MITGKQLKNKGTEIILDKKRILKFDLNAYCELEDIYGNIEKAFQDMQEGSLKAIRALLYAGLKGDDEALTIKKVGTFITIESIEEVTQILTNAFLDSMPEAKSDIEVDTKKK